MNELAKAIEGTQINVEMRAGSSGKLYGSVGPTDIARATVGTPYVLEKSEIDLPEGPIRTVGTYTVSVRLHSEVEASLIVVVEEEKA